MSLRFTVEDFDDYEHDPDIMKSTMCQALITNTGFKNRQETLAIVGCGGTISSVYSPLHETIHATNHSPTKDLLDALHESFGLAENDITYLPLINKDSREVAEQDLVLLLDLLNEIENDRILVTFGTFGVQVLTRIIAEHVITKNKVIVVTGSMLPSAFREQDADINSLAGISAINTVMATRDNEKEHDPAVFATFHGNVYMPGECISLNLHPASHSNVKFYRGVLFRTE